MKYRAEINIMPLKALLDPQGKAVTASMKNLGLGEIENVRIGKHISLEIEAPDKEKAGKMVEEACRKLLANLIMESYEFEIVESLMVVYPPAKINLGLRVGEKREDGYHNLETVFYPIPLTDILEINLAGQDKFTQTGLTVPGNSSENLCLKALALLRERVDVPPLNIHLHKQIPAGSGLGGGSADGSFALKAINQLCGLSFEDEVLAEMALQLGSDCPFFISARPAAARGRGEELHPLKLSLRGMWLVLLLPEIHVSTREAFAVLDASRLPHTPLKVAGELAVERWQDQLINDFEAPVFAIHPQLQELKKHLRAKGAVYASMSGSGSAIFGLFKEKPELADCPDSVSLFSMRLN